MFQLEHNSRFYRDTVEIAENSENHLKAIVGGRQVDGGMGLEKPLKNVVKEPQGEGKAADIGPSMLAIAPAEC
jgi:hypothetical protein